MGSHKDKLILTHDDFFSNSWALQNNISKLELIFDGAAALSTPFTVDRIGAAAFFTE